MSEDGPGRGGPAAGRMVWALAALVAAACDVTSTVGFNDRLATSPGSDAGDASDTIVLNDSVRLTCGDETDLARCSGEGANGCVVRELFSAERGQLSIVVDELAYYYLSTPQTLTRRPKAGGDPVDLATFNQVMNFTADATHVYWTDYHSYVGRVAKTGGPMETVMTPFGHPSEIVTDDENVYCVLPEEGEVAMTRKPGGPVTKVTGQAAPFGLAVDATHLYWINRGASATTGQLVRVPRGDLTRPEVVVSGLDRPLRLALDGDDAFVVEEDGDVRRVPKSGGAVSLVGGGLVEPKAVRAFRGRIYVAGMSGLVAMPASGGGPSSVLEARPVSALTLGCDGALGLLWQHEGQVVRYGR